MLTTLLPGGRGQIKERTAPRRATNTAGAWVSEELPSRGWCANTGSGRQDEGRMTMTDRDLRRFEIMDQYGVDEDTAEIMLLDEEEEADHERKG